MNKKRPVYRICVVTREKLLKEEMFRVVKIDNRVLVDIHQNIKGRGAYIKKDLKTIETSYKRHSLSKALKIDVKEDIYLSLVQLLAKEGDSK